MSVKLRRVVSFKYFSREKKKEILLVFESGKVRASCHLQSIRYDIYEANYHRVHWKAEFLFHRRKCIYIAYCRYECLTYISSLICIILIYIRQARYLNFIFAPEILLNFIGKRRGCFTWKFCAILAGQWIADKSNIRIKLLGRNTVERVPHRNIGWIGFVRSFVM